MTYYSTSVNSLDFFADGWFGILSASDERQWPWNVSSSRIKPKGKIYKKYIINPKPEELIILTHCLTSLQLSYSQAFVIELIVGSLQKAWRRMFPLPRNNKSWSKTKYVIVVKKTSWSITHWRNCGGTWKSKLHEDPIHNLWIIFDEGWYNGVYITRYANVFH